MKILVLSNLFPNRKDPAHGIFIKNRVMQYRNHGHELTVFVPIAWTPGLQKIIGTFDFNGFTYQDNIEGTKVVYFKYFHLPKVGMLLQPFSIYISAYFLIKKYGKHFCFNLIDAHYLYPDGVAAAILSKKLNLALIQSARGSDINIFFGFRITKFMIVRSLTFSNKIVTVSEGLKKILIQNGIDNDKIHVIPNGVDHTKFYPIMPLILKRSGNAHRTKRILMVGHLKEQKGQDLLIKVLRQMDDLNLPYRIVAYFIGHGPLENLIIREAKVKNCRNRIVLVGTVLNDQLVRWYNRMDLLCLLSESEGSPNVILEAISCGLPVLATDVGDLRNIVTERIGVIIENREIRTISSALQYMLNTQWNRQYIATYSARFNWQMVSRETNNIIKSI